MNLSTTQLMKAGVKLRGQGCVIRAAIVQGGVFRIPFAAIGKPRMTQSDKWKKRPCVMAYREWCDHLCAQIPNPPPAQLVKRVKITAIFAPSAKHRKELMFKPHRTRLGQHRQGGERCALEGR